MNHSKTKLRLINKIVIPTFLSLFLGASLNILIVGRSSASTHVGVAVYVNSTAITNTDILDRAKLTAGELGISFASNQSMLIKNTTRTLIVENLQIQYAKSKGITITRKDLDNFLVSTVKKLRYKNGIRSFLNSHNVKMKTFRQKAYAKLLWEKVMTLKTKADIMQNKTLMQQKMLDLAKSKDRYNLSEIVLQFKSEKDKQATLSFARTLRSKLQSHKGEFGAYALKFSQASTSAFEGNLGLVHLDSLAKSYKQDVKNLKVGGISQPIQLENSIAIFKRNTDTTKPTVSNSKTKVDSIQFYRLIMQSPELAKSGASSIQELTSQVTNFSLNCSDLDSYAKKLNSKQSAYAPETPIASLSPQYRNLLQNMKVAQAQPVNITDGVMIIMVCKRGKMIPPVSKTTDVNNMQKEVFTALLTQNSTDTLNELYSSAIISYN